jgi:DNA-directed RNA polymerase subunit RPC12/RpoP
VKFSCDRCGKKYATAEAPAPGRVYKLKCKACGHVIVVKTPASAPAVTPSPDEPISARVSSVSLPSAQPAEVEAEVEAPRPEPTPPPAPFQMPAGTTPVPSREAEPTAEISMMADAGQKPADGYVDIFAEAAPPPAPPVADDPFLKAARGSLPEHFSPSRPLADPFADMRDELDAPAPHAAPAPPPRHEPVPAAFAPPPARKEEKKKSGLPVALIGVGVAVVLGIVVAVALTSGKKTEPPAAKPVAPAPVAAPTPPPPPPAPAPTPAPAPEPARKAEAAKPKAEPVVARKDDKKSDQARLEAERKREEARLEADRKREQAKLEADRKREQARLDAERKREEDRRREEERKAEAERKRLAKAEAAKPKAEAEKPVQLPDATTALSPEAVQKVVNASRRAFEGCIAEAAKRGTDTKFDGRKVALRLNVNPNGFVTYPTLDDVTLNRTDLGECLKSAARLMVFPKFQGDVFHVEVPLTLRGG